MRRPIGIAAGLLLAALIVAGGAVALASSRWLRGARYRPAGAAVPLTLAVDRRR